MNNNNPNTSLHLTRQNARSTLTELLGEEAVKQLLIRSNWRGAWALVSCWGIIFLSMAAIVWAQSQALYVAIPVIICAILIIAGRQLGLSILMHEASHRSLFKSPWLNDYLADWLSGRFIFVDVARYRKHHMIHHTNTGTPDDNDYSLVKDFPTTRASMLRKFARDLSGITGLKMLVGLSLMNAGYLKWTVANDTYKLHSEKSGPLYYLLNFIRNAYPTLLVNGALAAACIAIGHGELYLAWLIAFLIPYQLFIRIRSIAEHAVTEMTPNMLKNTRSTRAGILAKLFVAPFNVNLHIEHHAMPAVAFWQLPKLHHILRELNAVPKPPSYFQVLNLVSNK